MSLVYQTTWHGWSFDATAYGPAQDKLALRRTTEDGLEGGGRTAVGRVLGPAYATFGLNAVGFENESEVTGLKQWAEAFGGDAEVTVHGNQVMAEFARRPPCAPTSPLSRPPSATFHGAR